MDWSALRPAMEAVSETTSELTPGAAAYLDQYGAHLRDCFDQLGLSMTDETVVAAALATVDAVMSLLIECHEADGITDEETLSAWTVLCIVARPLLDFVPAGAR